MSPDAVPKDLADELIASISHLEAIGSYLTRTELECVLSGTAHRQALASVMNSRGGTKGSKDIEGTYSFQVLQEALRDVTGQQALHLWRRNVALRQNRILQPARVAELYTLMINLCVGDGEWELVKQVLTYVGLTPARLYQPTTRTIDMRSIGVTVAGIMLDLDLERMEWERAAEDERGSEPLSPRQKGGDLADWYYKQVLPPGGETALERRVCDFALAVLRIAARHASAVTLLNETLSPVEVTLQNDSTARARRQLTQQGFCVPHGAVEAVISLDDILQENIAVTQS
ncbi:hypothetical protein JKP88DRAFT_261978 [Tribonema minus]|uniref:Uncharacterized protein n=1 Tax=Tribonema minus TaxID=303371 RepID=A0A836CM31_9STRA|nr:hypothetical protein JKP88DRAFT_261978 [Tribonema minus]